MSSSVNADFVEPNESVDSGSSGAEEIQPLHLRVLINDKKISLEVDTGSKVSTLTIAEKKIYFPDLPVKATGLKHKKLVGAKNSPLGVVDNLTVSYGSVTIHNQLMFIVNDSSAKVIGREWLHSLHIWPPKFLEGENVVEEGIERYFHLPIEPNSKPIMMPVRKVPIDRRDELKHVIIQLVDGGLLIPTEDSEWSTAIEPILDKNKIIGIVGDYRATINQYLVNDYSGLPAVCDILIKLKANRYFCKLCLGDGYIQIPLDEESQNLSTIVTTEGLFKFVNLQFGMATAPKFYHKYVTKNLDGLDFVIIGDYICLYANTLPKLAKRLSLFMKQFELMSLSIENDESTYFTESLDVFGVKITKNNISEFNNNVNPLLSLSPPTNASLLKLFLNTVNYFGNVLADVLHHLQPLSKLLYRENFTWTQACDRSFHAIKNTLELKTSALNLKNGSLMILNCHSTDHGIAAVLSAVDLELLTSPVAFASKKLNERERRFSQLDKDFLAIIYANEQFYDYLWGRKFILEINNKKLVDLLKATHNIRDQVDSQIYFWLLDMTLYDFKVIENHSSQNAAEYFSHVV